jgi:hypothetical protein
VIKDRKNSGLEDEETSKESRESREESVTIHLTKSIFKDFKLSAFR